MPNALNALCRLMTVSAMFVAMSAQARPSIPASDGEVLEVVAAISDPGEAELRRASAALANGPGNRALAVQVARLAIARGQRLADPREFGRAEAALSPWMAAAAPDHDIRLLRAILRQSNHDFDAALGDLAAVLDAEPRNAQARLTRAVIRVVRAEYPEAQDDCAHLIGVAAPGVMDTCVASVAVLAGHARPARVMLAMAAERADAPAGVRVWALTILGETSARVGETGEAVAAFEKARSLAPDDTYLLAAYADALLDDGRAETALALLDGHERADALLLRIAEAKRRLGRPATDLVGQLADRFATSRLRGETLHQREEARFALHVEGRADEALRLAQANWLVQREPADARILLEAALAAGVPHAATPVLAWRRDNGVEDVVMDRLAARIEAGRS